MAKVRRDPMNLIIAFSEEMTNKDRLAYLQTTKDDLNMKGRCGWTLLGVAIAHGDVESIKYLLSKGVKMHADDYDTPLDLLCESDCYFYGTQENRIRLAHLFLDAGENPFARGGGPDHRPGSRTSYKYAIRHGLHDLAAVYHQHNPAAKLKEARSILNHYILPEIFQHIIYPFVLS
jgi:hypothetical protein